MTATIEVRDRDGAATGTLELPSDIFDAPVNIPLMHQVVVAQQAAARQGTHATKTRGQVSGGGAKPYRQKGTGRARQGSRRAPQFTDGGTVHGPQPRSYAQRTPKKMKKAALRGALSDRARNGRVHVVTEFIDSDVPSTKQAKAVLQRLTTSRRVLVVADRDEVVTWYSLRNLPEVHLIAPDQLNTYDVLASDDVVFTARAYRSFTGLEVPVKESAGKSEQTAAAESEGAPEQDDKPAKKSTAKKSTAKKAASKKAASESAAADTSEEARA